MNIRKKGTAREGPVRRSTALKLNCFIESSNRFAGGEKRSETLNGKRPVWWGGRTRL